MELSSIPLSVMDLFTAEGNAFDHWAVDRCVGVTLVAWLRGGATPQPAYPSPMTVEALYQQLRTTIRSSPGSADLDMAAEVMPAPLMTRRSPRNGRPPLPPLQPQAPCSAAETGCGDP